MKINLGCGDYKYPGFLNIDVDPGVKPDKVSDIRSLGEFQEPVEFIYAGHVLEHLYYDKVPEYLQEWQRALVPGGRLAVLVPDVGNMMRRYASGEFVLDHLLAPIFGQWYSWDREEMKHRYVYDAPRLKETLSRVPTPWRSIEQYDVTKPLPELEHVFNKDWGVSGADWQLGMVCTK